ncbi:MAG TPA: hypothetical protein VFQ16_00235 [Burkholderiaceae bacterium]|nr:hypothetical protein [Burkholderiaceae bacterium]
MRHRRPSLLAALGPTLRAARLVPALAVLLAACGSAPLVESPAAAVPAALVWPKPPAPARIRFVRSVAAPADWGIERSALGRLVDSLTGQTGLHFVRPTGVAERAGVLYVADPGARALFILDRERSSALRIERVGQDGLVSPVALALAPDAQVYLADSVLKQVLLIDREGRLVSRIADARLQRPAGIAFDAVRSRLYVADSAAHRVFVFGSDGRLLRTLGRNGSADGEFNFPTHLALGREGELLVTDAMNFRVQAFDADGNFRWKLGKVGDGSGDFAAPKGVAQDRHGQVYVVDALFDAVQVLRSDGRLLLGFGQRGSEPGRFWLPGGLFMDGDSSRFYVADSYNQRIQVFDSVSAAGGGAEP